MNYYDAKETQQLLDHFQNEKEYQFLEDKILRKDGSVLGTKHYRRGDALREHPYLRFKCTTTSFKQTNFKVHQLLYMFHHGPISEQCTVDHIDRNTLNNHKDNLRLATKELQAQNRGNSNGSSFKGWSRMGNNYQVSLKFNHNNFILGSYKTPGEAEAVYKEGIKQRDSGTFKIWYDALRVKLEQQILKDKRKNSRGTIRQRNGKFCPQLKLRGKIYYFGRFKTEEEAREVLDEAVEQRDVSDACFNEWYGENRKKRGCKNQ